MFLTARIYKTLLLLLLLLNLHPHSNGGPDVSKCVTPDHNHYSPSTVDSLRQLIRQHYERLETLHASSIYLLKP